MTSTTLLPVRSDTARAPSALWRPSTSYHPNIKTSDFITADEELRLIREWKTSNSQTAITKLYIAYQPLFATFIRRTERDRDARDRLLAPCAIALISALNTYDETFGTRLSTHLRSWLYAILSEMHFTERHLIALPTNHAKMTNAAVVMRQARATGEAPHAIAARMQLTDAERAALAILAGGMSSLDQKIGPASEATLGDVIASPEDLGATVEAADLSEFQRKILASALAALTDREREIIRLRIYEGRTLEFCADIFGITKERVRQIYEHSLLKIRRSLKQFSPRDLLPD